MSLKEFWENNRHKIKPVLKLASRCVDSYTDLKPDPGVLDYVSLAFAFKENYEVTYRHNDPYNYFNNYEWRMIENPAIAGIIISLINRFAKSPISPTTVTESGSAYIGKLGDITFGWVFYEDELEKVFVWHEDCELYPEFISKAFWEVHSTNHMVMGNIPNSDSSITVYLKEEDWTNSTIYHSPRVDTYAEEIQAYIKNGVYRSILFYGPPGTGKSNLIRGISSKLGLKTIRIKDLSDISADIIVEVVKVFNPDAIILEDVDSASVKDISDLLDKIEGFNKCQKLTFGTANRINSLEDTLLRPGRFDETIEIKTLEPEVVRKLVGDDDQLFKLVKNYPAAFIAEVMKRVKTKGKEAALDNMKDLKSRLKKISRNNYELDDEEEENFNEVACEIESENESE